MNSSDWATVAGQVIDALASVFSDREASISPSEKQIYQLGKQIDHIRSQIDAMQLRDFEQKMAAGIRHLRDLPPEWRDEQDRRDLIRDARNEFVRAVGIAELAGDIQRQALAEVAIAGCWLWVPSLPDVRHTIGVARCLLEDTLLGDDNKWRDYRNAWISSYTDVLALCKSYDEQPGSTAMPISYPETPTRARQAALVVRALVDQWVGCVGIEVKPDRPQVNTVISKKAVSQQSASRTAASHTRQQHKDSINPPPPVRYVETTEASYALALEVRNTRADPISVVLAEVLSPVPTWAILPNREGRFNPTKVMVTGTKPGKGQPITVLIKVQPKGTEVAFLVELAE